MRSGQYTVYRDCTPVVDSRYEDGGEQTPVEAVVDAVAETADVDSTSLPSLYEVVDTDALNQLFVRGERTDQDYAQMILGFQFNAWNVFVRADGRIQVCDATESTDPEPVFAPADD